MKKNNENVPDLIKWVNFIINTKPLNTIAGLVVTALGVGITFGGVYSVKYSLTQSDTVDKVVLSPPNESSEK